MILVIWGHCTYPKISTSYGGTLYLNLDASVPSIGYKIIDHLTTFIYFICLFLWQLAECALIYQCKGSLAHLEN